MKLAAFHLAMQLKNKHLNSKVVTRSVPFVKIITYHPLKIQTAHASMLALKVWLLTKIISYAMPQKPNAKQWFLLIQQIALLIVVQIQRRQQFLWIMENILNALPARSTMFLPLKLQASALKSAQAIQSQMPQPFLAYRTWQIAWNMCQRIS